MNVAGGAKNAAQDARAKSARNGWKQINALKRKKKRSGRTNAKNPKYMRLDASAGNDGERGQKIKQMKGEGKDKLILATLCEYAPVEVLAEYMGARKAEDEKQESEGDGHNAEG